MISDFWHGIESGYPICCVIFFCDFWEEVRKKKSMFCYGESSDYDTHLGFIQCPECIVDMMENKDE